MIKRAAITGLALGVLWAAPQMVHAQNADADEESRFVRFVENQISSPNMQIRLIGLQGTLSSNVSLDRITISDDDGVWLSIEQPRLEWRRAALLRGRLVIDELSADSLNFERLPLADDSLPAPEARDFSLPQLPVSVQIDALDLPEASFGEPVFGLASVLSLAGSLSLNNDALDADLAINRLDGPGGSLNLDVALASSELDMDVVLEEPADGVLANLLNIGGRPPVSLEIAGGGPLSDLAVTLDFQTDGQPVIAGEITSSRGFLASATVVDFTLGGPLARVLPEEDRIFFGDRTDMSGEIRLLDAGGFEIEGFDLSGGALTADFSGTFLQDGFPTRLDGTIDLSAPEDGFIPLPGSPDLRVGSARLAVNWSDSQWSADGQLDALAGAEFALGRASLVAGGTIENAQTPETRMIDYQVQLAADGFAPDDADVARAIGASPEVLANGVWNASGPLLLNAFDLSAAAASITGNGQFGSNGFDGAMRIDADDLAAFSGLADRPLAGQGLLRVDGTVNPITGAFDLDVDGALLGLSAGEDLAGRMLEGDTRLTGGVARTVDGLAFREFQGENARAQFALNGQASSGETDLAAAVTLTDLGDIQPQSSGTAGAQFRLSRPAPDEETGETDPLSVTAQVLVPNGQLASQPVSNLDLGFAGTIAEDIAQGSLSGTGSMAGNPLTLTADLAAQGERYTLSNFDLNTGDADLAGNLVLENGLAEGALNLEATDIAGLAALALVEASGGVSLNVALNDDDGSQNVNADGTISNLAVADVTIGAGDVEAALTDLLGTPAGTVSINGQNIVANGMNIDRVSANVQTVAENSIDFDANAELAGTGTLATDGNVVIDGDTYEVALDRLSLDSAFGDARLASTPARITVDPSGVRLNAVALNVAGGQITLDGSAGEQLALNARIASLPLAIANAFRPDLGLAGEVGGEVTVTGSASSPQAMFAINGAGITAAALGGAGVEPFTLAARGQATGSQLRLDNLSASNRQGLDLAASGTVPIDGGGLNVSASGTAPLVLAETALAGRGIQLDGTVRFEGRATGSTASPNLNGLISIAGGRITDPQSNIELTDVSLLAGLEGEQIVIRNGSAAVRGGGGLNLSGRIGLTGAQNADLTIELSNANYTDGRSVSADVSAAIRVTGPLAGGALIAGTIDIARAEIIVAEIVGGSTDFIAVEHINTDPGTLATLRRIDSLVRTGGGASGPPFALDLTINAPNQIFVRGRGLDAELGGQLRIGGTLANIVPTGGFQLIRGRLLVLDQRFDLTSGRVTLVGDLDPFIDFTAQVSASSVVASIRLVGPASNLSLELSSSPTLPEDEVLAAVLFGSDVSSLSPVQIARLADAAAALAGGQGGLTGGLRGLLGVDELDIVEGRDGGVGVRVGQYVTDNVYLGLETGSDGVETTINLDITNSLTARGSVASDGDSSIGVFFERDY